MNTDYSLFFNIQMVLQSNYTQIIKNYNSFIDNMNFYFKIYVNVKYM